MVKENWNCSFHPLKQRQAYQCRLHFSCNWLFFLFSNKKLATSCRLNIFCSRLVDIVQCEHFYALPHPCDIIIENYFRVIGQHGLNYRQLADPPVCASSPM